jgi:hypothetical protein
MDKAATGPMPADAELATIKINVRTLPGPQYLWTAVSWAT